MDESRFRVANVHHIYTRMAEGNPSGFVCLCGAVMGKHRDCTEHIVDAYRADLRAKVEALPTMGTLHSPLNPEPSTMVVVLRSDVLALIDGDTQ